MTEALLADVALLVVLAVGGQWLAWYLRVPSILILSLAGIAAGPVLGLIDPDAALGELLLPLVSVGVATLLFEGGLGLRIRELRQVGGTLLGLVSVGLLATGAVAALAARFILGVDWAIAALLGAILVVSGPTVIHPLLRHIRPTPRLHHLLKWEGIVIDPLGALVAILVFQAIQGGPAADIGAATVRTLVATLAVGLMVGLIAAGFTVFALYRRAVPDQLHSPVILMLVVAVYAISNQLQAESGLVAATLFGIGMANQRWVPVAHIIEFKENIRVLIIGFVFILLTARLRPEEFLPIWPQLLLFLAVLVLVARPAAVWLSTLGSRMTRQERVFVAWMAPRGIVAASIASVFALRLQELGYVGADLIVPVTFAVVLGTVALYGLTAPALARRLDVAKPDPQGLLIVGAQRWSRRIGKVLKDHGFRTVFIDSDVAHITQANVEGLEGRAMNALSETLNQELELYGIGRLLALTSNDEVNTLATLHFAGEFGRSNVYQLAPVQPADGAADRGLPMHLSGRILFGADVTYDQLASRFRKGHVVKATKITDKFDMEAFRKLYGESALPLFLLPREGALDIFTTTHRPKPQAGHTLIALVEPVEETDRAAAQVPETTSARPPEPETARRR